MLLELNCSVFFVFLNFSVLRLLFNKFVVFDVILFKLSMLVSFMVDLWFKFGVFVFFKLKVFFCLFVFVKFL